MIGCGASQDDAPRITIGGVELVAPTDWQASDLGGTVRQWTPPDNGRKESLTVIVGPTFLGTSEHALDRVRVAQGVLHDEHMVASTPLVTRAGLVGTWFDVTFAPDSAPGRLYHRSHVVVVAGDHLVHVLYTALDPEPSRAVLRGVVNSLQQGG